MTATMPDYYAVLGVAVTASAEDLKQGFRKLARIHHPDVAKDAAVGEARFKEINEAYEVLGDPEQRRRYDAMRAADAELAAFGARGSGRTRSRPGGPGATPDFEFDGTGFSDFFSAFFGDRHQGGSTGRRSRGATDGPAAGEDVTADLLVTLEESLRGVRRKVTLRRTGSDGDADRANTYEVQIPAGVREGQRIRLAGQGRPGQAGGAPGELYLRVRLALHPDFRTQGDDLYCDLDLAPWEAVLGVQLLLPTLGGAATLRVPPGTAAGRLLRLRGLGLPRADRSRGDLLATVRIQVPDMVSEDERARWAQLASTSTFNPRVLS